MKPVTRLHVLVVLFAGGTVVLPGVVSAREPLSLVSVLHHKQALNRAHDIDLQGNHAFVAGKGGCVAIVDVSQPAEPRLLWHRYDADGLHDAETVLLGKQRLFLGTNDLHSVNIAHPRKPVFTGRVSNRATISHINGMVRRGNLIFAACKSGWVDAFDVTVPAKPKLAVALNVRKRFQLGSPHDIDLYRSFVIVAEPERFGRTNKPGKLAVVQMFNNNGRLLLPEKCTLAGVVTTRDLIGANRVQVAGDYAFVATSTPGNGGRLVIVDLRRPEHSRQIASVSFADPDGFGANGLTVAGKVVFLSGGRTLQAVDISRPQNPKTLARWTSRRLFPTGRDNGHDLVFRNNLLYVTAQNDDQIGIVRIEDERIRRLTAADERVCHPHPLDRSSPFNP